MKILADTSGVAAPESTFFPTLRLQRWLAAAFLRERSARLARRQRKAVGGLTDRELKDIGLESPDRAGARREDPFIFPFAGG